jgi:outer membrane lipoprotein SlyB
MMGFCVRCDEHRPVQARTGVCPDCLNHEDEVDGTIVGGILGGLLGGTVGSTIGGAIVGNILGGKRRR